METSIHRYLENIDFALDHNRNQYHSTAVLDRLSSLDLPANSRIVALTEKDLFIPILTHVYGEAELGGVSCIVSSSRLKDDLPAIERDKLLGNRIIKEILHELGHTFHLLHCRDKSCLMHYCRSIRDVDRKVMGMCRYCSILLEDQLKRG